MDGKLELVFVPVSDVDRAKDFYVNKVGFNADYDERPGGGIRFVQLTPPGSACSICIGEGLNDARPGTAPSLQMVVTDIQAAHDHLKGAWVAGGVLVAVIVVALVAAGVRVRDVHQMIRQS